MNEIVTYKVVDSSRNAFVIFWSLVRLLFTQYLTFTYFTHVYFFNFRERRQVKIPAGEMPTAKRLANRILHIRDAGFGDAVWNVTRLIERNASRGLGDWDDNGMGEVGCKGVIAECAERAKEPLLIRYPWLISSYPSQVPSNNGVSFVDGKEDIAVERQSTGNDRCVYWLKRFPTLFEPCRARFIFAAARSRY